MAQENISLTSKQQVKGTYGEPPPAYQPYGSGQPMVIVNQQVYEDPVPMKCTYCRADIITKIHHETGTVTWLASGLMCLVGLWAGCCLIPFCLDAAKDVVHTCPSCQRVVGRYTRM